MTWPLPLIVIELLVALFIVAMFICAMFHRAIEQLDYELLDDVSTYIDSYLESFIIDDETTSDEQYDALPKEVYDGLLEYGLDPNLFYIDPTQPNTILRKPEYGEDVKTQK